MLTGCTGKCSESDSLVCKASRLAGSSDPFDSESNRIAAAEAEGGDAPISVVAPHGMKQGDEDAGATGSDGMTESDRTTMDIDFRRVEGEFAIDGEGLHSEGLVEFE